MLGRHLTAAAALALILLIPACRSQINNEIDIPEHTSPAVQQGVLEVEWPVALPADGRQPWEQVVSREASSINRDSQLISGVDCFDTGGNASGNGEALRLQATSGSISHALYRMPLDGSQPGVVSVDANLIDGEYYYVGLSDYGAGRWAWHGPYSDSHVRLRTSPGGNYASPFGNMFMAVLVHDGSGLDVVCIGMNTADPLDSTAPPVPVGLTAMPVEAGLLLDWDAVSAGDLAGYAVYHSLQPFVSPAAAGVERVDNLQGQLGMLLPLQAQKRHYIRVSAVDSSGNESAVSEIVSEVPLDGAIPPLHVYVDRPSAALQEVIAISASGADTYDFDLDGDGIFDVTGSTDGTAQVDTGSLGVIRPAVRGVLGDETCVALGSVSLVISGNSRPVASAGANPASGDAPLDVAFSGADSIDFDGEIVGGGWDFDGDGIYDEWDDADPGIVLATSHIYTVPGTYNAKLRVLDDGGSWDVDTLAITVTGVDPGNSAPSADLRAWKVTGYEPFLIEFNGIYSTDSDGTIELYEWDFDGDGAFDKYGEIPSASHVYPFIGNYYARMRVTDDGGATSTGQLLVTLPSEWWCFGMGPRNLRNSPYVGTEGNNLKWSYDTPGSITSSPAIGADGTVYIGGEDGNLYAFNSNGSLKWYYTTAGGIRSSPAIGPDGTIYFGSLDGNIYALNRNGSLRWMYVTGDQVYSSAAIGTDGSIYIGSHDDKLYAFHPNGNFKWSFATGGNLRGVPAIGPDGTIYASSLDYKVYAIGPDGVLKWSFTTGNDVFSSPAIWIDGSIYFGSYDNKLYALNPDGTERWSYTCGEAIFSSPAIAQDGAIVFGSLDDNIYCLENDGSLRWNYLTGNSVHASAAIDANGTVFIGSYDGNLYSFEADGSLRWFYSTGDNIRSSAAIGADGTVYFGSRDSYMYALND